MLLASADEGVRLLVMSATRSIAKKTTALKQTETAQSGAKRPLKIEPAGKQAARRSSATGPLAPERVDAILKGLDEAYPNAVCALDHRTPWELLVATILSAQ